MSSGHSASRDVTARGLFVRHGLRHTRQRQAIYEALAATKEHPTADDLFRMVSPRAPGLSLATVYNTLEAFCEAGLAMRIASTSNGKRGMGSARYDATVDNHLHLRCQQTGAVADVPEEISQRLLDRIPSELLAELEAKLGFKVEQVQIEFIGKFDGGHPTA
ncbi:MAG: transcriptional repressor [Phycisphaeraceae bacterium]|nr:transcriptional repressor [Phycisphaeraceae bacterium]